MMPERFNPDARAPSSRQITRSPVGRIPATVAGSLRAVLPIFLVTRVGVLAIGYFSLVAFGWARGQPPIRVSENELINLPYRYDAGWYLSIARNGYRWDPAVRGQQSIAFFPGFPLTVRAVSAMTRLRLFPAAMIVTFAAALGSFLYLYRLAREDVGEDEAFAAVLLLATYPFAVFFSAPYSESLCLLAALGAWYHARRDDPLRCGAWGVLCGLTRPNGGLLALPLAVMALPFARDDRCGHGASFVRRTGSRLLAAVMPAVGTTVFSGFLWRLTGSPWAWVTAAQAWGRQYAPLTHTAIEWWRAPLFFNGDVGATAMVDYATGWIVIGLLCAAVPVGRRFGLPAALLMMVWLIPPLLAGGLLSMGRVTSTLFPVFIWLGACVPPRHRPLWAATFAAGQTLVAAMFFTWRPVF